MEHKIPCSIIQDLMPLYVDGLTSDLTNTEIERHLEECDECQAGYNRMKSSIENNNSRQSKREIDYLKKINISQKRNLLIGSIISFILGLSLPILRFTKSFIKTILNGGRIPAYYSARLSLIWPHILIKMIISGLIVVVLYFVIRLLIKKFKS